MFGGIVCRIARIRKIEDGYVHIRPVQHLKNISSIVMKLFQGNVVQLESGAISQHPV